MYAAIKAVIQAFMVLLYFYFIARNVNHDAIRAIATGMCSMSSVLQLLFFAYEQNGFNNRNWMCILLVYSDTIGSRTVGHHGGLQWGFYGTDTNIQSS